MDGNYQIANGTHYHNDTPFRVVTLLEESRIRGHRLTIYYQGERFPVEGTVARSTGTRKTPLLLTNSRSMQGDEIDDHLIERIYMARGKQLLYQAKDQKK